MPLHLWFLACFMIILFFIGMHYVLLELKKIRKEELSFNRIQEIEKSIKSYGQVIRESTCQKRNIVCEIYDQHNNLIARESNRCEPSGGLCHRLNVIQGREDYDVISECNWTHAEINAIKALPSDTRPHMSIIYGHDFYCKNCEDELRNVGIKIFAIGEI